jgi:hypothetical protein
MAWIQNHEVPYSSLERFSVHALADFQLGSSSCNVDLVKNTIARIAKDKNGILVIAGDIEDSDRPTTRIMRQQTFAGRREVLSWDAKNHQAWIDQEVLPLLAPLAQMPLGFACVLAGHHWTQLDATTNSVEYICNRLSVSGKRNVPYLGEMSAWIRLKFIGKGKYKGKNFTKMLHVQHGVGGGGTLASALARLEKTVNGFPCDAAIRAHSCHLTAGKIARVSPEIDSEEVALYDKTVALLNIGSATRGYDLTKSAPDYVEAGMMNPLASGWGSLHFDLRDAYPWEGAGVNCDIRIEI